MKNTRSNQTQQRSEETSRQAECNSVVLEPWFGELPWQAKLAACLLNQLLTADSERLLGIGRQILERLHNDVIETDAVPKVQDMAIREMYLLLSE